MAYDLEIDIREPCPDDLQYLYNTWVRSQRYNRPFDKLEKCWYNAAATTLISRILSASKMLVACNISNQAQIFGYVIFDDERRCLHWIYVKKSFREASVATRLMEQAFGDFNKQIAYTVRTTAIPHYEERWNLAFKPHMIVENKE